jgi:hypothetical protein
MGMLTLLKSTGSKLTRFSAEALVATAFSLLAPGFTPASTIEAEAEWAKAQNDYTTRLSKLSSPTSDQLAKLKAEVLEPKRIALEQAYAEKARHSESAAMPLQEEPSPGSSSASANSGPTTKGFILDGSTVPREIEYGARGMVTVEPAAPGNKEIEPEITYAARKPASETATKR